MTDASSSRVLLVDATPRRRRRLVKVMEPLGADLVQLQSVEESEQLQGLEPSTAAVVVVPIAQCGGSEALLLLRQRLPHASVVLLAAHDEVQEAVRLAERHRSIVSELPVLNPAWLRLLVAHGLRASQTSQQLEAAGLRELDQAMAALGALGYRDAKAALLARFDSVYTKALLDTLGKQGAMVRSALSSSGFRELCRRAKAARDALTSRVSAN